MPKFSPHSGKQVAFLRAQSDWVFYGGARGGGKSLMLAWKAALTPRKWTYKLGKATITKRDYNQMIKLGKKPTVHVDKISIDYPDYIGILMRRTFPQLERNLKPECDKLYRLYGAKWQERNKCYQFPSGAKVYLVHCQDRRALDNYIGGNYNFIGIDEANQFPESWVEELATSARTDNDELKPQVCLTSNPGNIGHVWLKRWFVDRCPPLPGRLIHNEDFNIDFYEMKTNKPYRDDEGITYQFIPATVFDNPTILENDPAYVKKLKKLNPILRAMWLEGRWDVFAGTYFDNFNIMHHVLPPDEFEFGTHFKRGTHSFYRFYDYGTKAPFVCLFAAVDRDENMVVFDEISETGLSASQQARLVNKYTWKKYQMRASDFDDEIADPSFWTKASAGELFYSPAMYYEDEGITLSKGNNDRKAGAKVVYEAFNVPDEGRPRIVFKESCVYCVETIPNLPSAENNPEDIDTKSEDHAYDALRYGCMSVLTSLRADTPTSKKGWRERIFGEERDENAGNWKTL